MIKAIYNNVEHKMVFIGVESEFIAWVRRITIENGDANYPILGMFTAIEYVKDFCDNLDVVKTDNEDLKALLKLRYYFVDHFRRGICATVTDLLCDYRLITYNERMSIVSHMESNKPSKEERYCNHIALKGSLANINYWWPLNLLEPRIDWIDKQILKLYKDRSNTDTMS